MAGDEPTGKTKMRDAMSARISFDSITQSVFEGLNFISTPAVVVIGLVFAVGHFELHGVGSASWVVVLLALSAGLLTRKLPAVFAYIVSIYFVTFGVYSCAMAFHMAKVAVAGTYLAFSSVGVLFVAMLLVYLEWYDQKCAELARTQNKIPLGPKFPRRILDLVTLAVLLIPELACCVLVFWSSDMKIDSIESVLIGYPAIMIMVAFEGVERAVSLLGMTFLSAPLARFAVLRVTAIHPESMRPKRRPTNFFGDN